MAKKSAAVKMVYQFKISLDDTEPAIWRRIQVADCTLDEFHEHIQSAMGWTNSHLHEFEIDGKRYGDPGQLEDDNSVDSTSVRLSELLDGRRKGYRIRYTYDFGDGWEHRVAFEGTQPTDAKIKYPVCLDGARACPPEDCGGPWVYYHLCQKLADPKHPEHEEMLEWAGPLDPEKFSAKAVNKDMRVGTPTMRW
jgi:Plasmid pRiA4b ORF-3-like protein